MAKRTKQRREQPRAVDPKVEIARVHAQERVDYSQLRASVEAIQARCSAWTWIAFWVCLTTVLIAVVAARAWYLVSVGGRA